MSRRTTAEPVAPDSALMGLKAHAFRFINAFLHAHITCSEQDHLHCKLATVTSGLIVNLEKKGVGFTRIYPK